jgi:hypothetical protein
MTMLITKMSQVAAAKMKTKNASLINQAPDGFLKYLSEQIGMSAC